VKLGVTNIFKFSFLKYHESLLWHGPTHRKSSSQLTRSQKATAYFRVAQISRNRNATHPTKHKTQAVRLSKTYSLAQWHTLFNGTHPLFPKRVLFFPSHPHCAFHPLSNIILLYLAGESSSTHSKQRARVSEHSISPSGMLGLWSMQLDLLQGQVIFSGAVK